MSDNPYRQPIYIRPPRADAFYSPCWLVRCAECAVSIPTGSEDAAVKAARQHEASPEHTDALGGDS